MDESWLGNSLEAQALVEGLRRGSDDALETFVRMFAPRAIVPQPRLMLGSDNIVRRP